MKKTILAIIASGLLAASANAEVKTATFNTSLTIVGSCDVTANPLTFLQIGNRNLAADDLKGSTTINVTCTSGLAYKVGLESSGKMSKAGTDKSIAYSLFQDSDRNLKWANTTDADKVSGVGHTFGATNQHTVYAQYNLDDAMVAPAGTYSDVVTVSVEY